MVISGFKLGNLMYYSGLEVNVIVLYRETLLLFSWVMFELYYFSGIKAEQLKITPLFVLKYSRY